MSQHLERDFPAVRWHASLPPSIERDLRRQAIARAHRLRAEAMRRGVGAVVGAIAGFVRFGGYGIAKRAPAPERRAPAKHGA